MSPWLTHGFDASLKKFQEFAATMVADGKPRLSSKTLPSYLTKLRNLHKVAEDLEGQPIAFGEAFDLAVNKWIAAVPGRSLTQLAEKSGASISQIRAWRRPDARPKASGPNAAVIARRSNRASIDEMDDMPDFGRVAYIPKTHELPEVMRQFYDAIDIYKTSYYPGKNAGGDALRRSGAQALRRNKKVDPGSLGEPSNWSIMFQPFMSIYFGFLTLPNSLEAARNFILENKSKKPFTESNLPECYLCLWRRE